MMSAAIRGVSHSRPGNSARRPIPWPIGVAGADDSEQLGPDQLAGALRARKASARFADRNDLDISGDAGASYGQVIQAIDDATASGFTAWRLITPAQWRVH
jgi:hypothetical protein